MSCGPPAPFFKIILGGSPPLFFPLPLPGGGGGGGAVFFLLPGKEKKTKEKAARSHRRANFARFLRFAVLLRSKPGCAIPGAPARRGKGAPARWLFSPPPPRPPPP